jgi:hypothetical protein
MELLESQDPEKIKLIETSDRHKRELEKEMKSMTDKTEKVVTTHEARELKFLDLLNLFVKLISGVKFWNF